MGEFEIQYSQAAPSGRPNAAPIVADVMAPGRAIAQAGSDIANMGQRMAIRDQRKAEEAYKMQVFAETQNGKIAIDELDAEYTQKMKATRDVNALEALRSEWTQKRGSLAQSLGTKPESSQDLNFYSRATQINAVDGRIDDYAYNLSKDNARVAFYRDFDATAQAGRFDLLAAKNQAAYNQGVITDSELLSNDGAIPRLQHDWAVNDVKTRMDATLGVDLDKTAAYAILDKDVADGKLSLDDKKEIGDWLDNMVSGRQASKERDQYAYTVDFYKQAVDKLQLKNLDADMIAQSKMTKEDKQDWLAIVREQHSPSPEANDFAAYQKTMDSMTLFWQGNITEQQLYDELLTSRYVDKTITTDTFNWAVQKTREPYEPHVAQNLRQTLSDNMKYTEWFGGKSSERKAIMETNRKLLTWLDSQIEAKKTPTLKEMQVASALYFAGSAPQYSVGDVIKNSKGQRAEVVDFDSDGTPLLEPIKD